MSDQIDLSPVLADLDICARDATRAAEMAAEDLGLQMADYARSATGPMVVRRRRVGGRWQDVSIQATPGGWAPDTGHLQGAIDHTVETRGRRVTLWLRAMMGYAWYLEQREGFSVVSHAVERYKSQIVPTLARYVNHLIR